MRSHFDVVFVHPALVLSPIVTMLARDRMKRWLCLSLLLNAALAGAWWHASGRATAPDHPVQPVGPHFMARKNAAAGDTTNSAETGPAAKGAEWTRWLGALRGAGVSSRVLAGLVTADFEERWEKRLAQLQRDFEQGRLSLDDLVRIQRGHDAELEKEMRLALGDEGFRQWDKAVVLREMGASALELSTAEGEAAYALRKDLVAQLRAAEAAHDRGELDESDLAERLSTLERDHQEKLKPLLGAERYAALQGRGDDIRGELRRELRKIALEPAQFDALAEARRASDREHAEVARQEEGGAKGVDFELRRAAIDAAREREYERVLGPVAYADYQRNNDTRYQVMQRYANAWKISEAEIAGVYATIRSYENTVRGYRQQALAAEQVGQPADWVAVQRRITQYTQQTEDALRRSLGEERFEKLKRHSALTLEQ
ncbi:MAG TPA: hypothetical protein VM029_20400 [Opitutaceae bacterium]|nr:hypothetical protein [Opitutaceae bacterium]